MEKIKTPLMNLIEFMELEKERINSLYPGGLEKVEELSKVGKFIAQAKSLLPTERDMIENTFSEGVSNTWFYEDADGNHKETELFPDQYFTQTFESYE